MLQQALEGIAARHAGTFAMRALTLALYACHGSRISSHLPTPMDMPTASTDALLSGSDARAIALGGLRSSATHCRQVTSVCWAAGLCPQNFP